MNRQAICDAIRAVNAAKKTLGNVVAANFPVGSEIRWERGGHFQIGNVIKHNDRGNVFVENQRTGKRYWIGMFDVVGYVT